jgi:hypothetical protein
MHFQPSLAILTAVALSSINVVVSTAIKIVTPCPYDAGLNLVAVTVTSKYQPVPTCVPKTVCIKGKCSTRYTLTSYLYVSTIVPHAWNGTTSRLTTITDVEQPYRASEYSEVLTTITLAPALHNENSNSPLKFGEDRQKPITRYETITRRAVAPFREIGPLAIPGWDGSGLCNTCESDTTGRRSQLLDVIECRYSSKAGKRYQKCFGWFERWEDFNVSTSAITTSVSCSTEGSVTKAGTYTWTFTQKPHLVAVTTPVQNVTIIVNGHAKVIVPPRETYIMQAKPWNAYITKSFTAPAYYRFTTRITETIVYTLPFRTQLASR